MVYRIGIISNRLIKKLVKINNIRRYGKKKKMGRLRKVSEGHTQISCVSFCGLYTYIFIVFVEVALVEFVGNF